jgi:hypothetical protein
VSRIASRLTLGLLALGLVAWILPVERVLREVARVRTSGPPLGVEARVSGIGAAEGEAARVELHPDRGVRLLTASGQRWLVRDARVIGQDGASPPAWLPRLDILIIRSEQHLRSWLAELQADPSRNGLARCGEADCFVIGGLDGPAQLWIDKDRFEVRGYRTASGRRVRFEAWSDRAGRRFPGVIEIEDSLGPVARVEVDTVREAPELEGADFSHPWLGEGPAARP